MAWVWVVAGVIALAAAGALFLFFPRRRSREDQARLERAAARIDTELAGNLELVTMYGQTRQAVVLELAGYQASHGVIAAADARLARRIDALYELIPYAEEAMERRGPAGSVKPEDRATVHNWEAGARDVQLELRALPRRSPETPGHRLVDRLRRRLEGRQATP